MTDREKLTERNDAIRIAQAILDKTPNNPDSDECILARQFLRALDSPLPAGEVKGLVERIAKASFDATKQCAAERGELVPAITWETASEKAKQFGRDIADYIVRTLGAAALERLSTASPSSPVGDGEALATRLRWWHGKVMEASAGGRLDEMVLPTATPDGRPLSLDLVAAALTHPPEANVRSVPDETKRLRESDRQITADEVLDWLATRPGISWRTTSDDIIRAMKAISGERARERK